MRLWKPRVHPICEAGVRHEARRVEQAVIYQICKLLSLPVINACDASGVEGEFRTHPIMRELARDSIGDARDDKRFVERAMQLDQPDTVERRRLALHDGLKRRIDGKRLHWAVSRGKAREF